MKKRILLLILTILPFFAFTQRTITGIVLDEDGKPLVLANIQEAEGTTPNGAVTDLDGKFRLYTAAKKLIVSYTGFKVQELILTDASHYQVVLQADYVSLSGPLIGGESISNKRVKEPGLSVLEKTQVERNSETSFAPILNQMPGVIMHEGTLSTNRIAVRGIGNRSPFGTTKLRAMLDGIPLTNGSGETALEDIDINIVQKITLYRGPSPSRYGANLGGHLNLETAKIENLPASPSLFWKKTIGSFGLQRSVAQVSKVYNKKNFILVNLNNTTSDGYRENNDYKRWSFMGLGRFQLDERNHLTVLGNYTSLNSDIPSSLNRDTFQNNPRAAAPTWLAARGFERYSRMVAGATLKGTFGKHFSQEYTIYASYRGAYENRPFNILTELSVIKGARANWGYNRYFEKAELNLKVKVGGEIYNENYDWQTYETDGLGNNQGSILSDNEENRSYGNGFVEAKLETFEELEITGGLNGNYTFYRLRDRYIIDSIDLGGSRTIPLTISPYFKANLKLSNIFLWDFDLSVFALYSEGFSAPSLEETLLPNGQVNKDILPERGRNYEFGIKSKPWQRFSCLLSFHSMQVRNLLVARRTGLGEYVGINAGETRHNGLEFELGYDDHFSKKWDFSAQMSYTFFDYRFTEFVDDTEDYSGNELTGTPSHLFHLSFFIKEEKGFYGNAQFRFVDAMPLRDDNSVYSEAYTLLNAKVGYLLEPFKKIKLDLFLGVNNILNERYASMHQINASSFGGGAPRYYYPGLPTHFYAGIKVSF